MARNPYAKYGLTVGGYTALFKAQNGACATCKRTSTELNGRKLCVDHDHATGAVRGLLCPSCNTAIGMLRESHDVLSEISKYLGGEYIKEPAGQPLPALIADLRAAGVVEYKTPELHLRFGAEATPPPGKPIPEPPDVPDDDPPPQDWRFALEELSALKANASRGKLGTGRQ